MRRKNQTILGFLSAAVDALLTFLAYLAAVVLRFQLLDGVVSIDMGSTQFQLVAWGYAFLIVLVYAGFHFYRPFRIHRPGRDSALVLVINLVGVLALMSILFTFKLIDVSRGSLVLFYGISSFLIILKLAVLGRVRQALRKNEKNLRHVIVIGNGKNARRYMEEVREQPELGIKIEGYVSAVTKEGMGTNLGSYEELEAILEKGDYDSLVVALEPHEISFMPDILKAADREGTRVEMIPMYNEYYPTHPTIESIGDTKLVDLRATPLDNIALAAVKRTGDILVSALLLVLLSPLLLILAIGVKISSPGPVLFKQDRIGRNKKPFTMLKFRSMRTDIDHDGWTTDADPRKTRFGSFIRKFSLDELPQLWNVLVGQMSLVGPRPEIPVYVRQFKEEVPLYLVRQQVRPGMTGWAQIHGLRGDTSIESRVDYDIWYIQNWSLALDLKILFKTAFGGMVNSERLTSKP